MTATKGKIGVLIEEHFDATEFRRFNEYFPAQGYEVEYLSHLAVGAYLLLYLILSVPLADVYNVHWATYVNGYCDTRAAKRVISPY